MFSTKYGIERFIDCKNEIEGLLVEHYAEVRLHKTEIALNYNPEHYQNLDNLGTLHLMIARLDDKIIGYHCSFLQYDIHSKDNLLAVVDNYFLQSDYRKGFAGIRLIRAAELSLKQRGVMKIYCSATKHLNTRKVFEYLNYFEEEIIFSKLL